MAANAAIKAFVRANHLTVVRVKLGKLVIVVSGTSARLSAAFGVTRTKYTSSLGTFYGHSGPVHIPQTLAKYIDGVIGLNQFPVRRISGPKTGTRPGRRTQSYHPFQMARLYNCPAGANGRGECVALIELGGGFNPSAIRRYFRKLRLPVPKISVVMVDGALNKTSQRSKANDLEVQGDIETLGSVAPGARIVVYIAPMTERGMYDAVAKAVHDHVHKPSIISVSFGEVEMYWPPLTLRLLNEALARAADKGITICCAAGDSGSSGGVRGGKPHVFFPASSPHVLACGGTQLKTSGNTIVEESVWQDGRQGTTGGGVSRIFVRPTWQKSAKVPASPNKQLRNGRGLPDVAANAAGYLLIADGKSIMIGGTSAVAPLWAGLLARLNQKLGRRLGFVNPELYTCYGELLSKGAIREITKRSNGTYRARKGWNPCSGLGSPDGEKLAAHLATRQ